MKKGIASTSFDIAELAGVSQPTVSRALRNSPLVSAETRERVQAIARELNYKVDKNAANLRSKTTKTLAVLIFDDAMSGDGNINPFFLSMLGSITRTASIEGYDLLVSFQEMSEDWHSQYLAAHRADGLILLGYGDYIVYQEKLQALNEAGSNFVIWGPQLKTESACSLSCNNRLGGELAGKHLLELGHRQIVFLGNANDNFPEYQMRYEGFLKAHEDAGVALAESHCIPAPEDNGYAAIGRLLDSGQQFTAIFAASDFMAMGAVKAVNERGLRVPDDISVVGFDDILAANYLNPPLTTVRQDTTKAGRLMVERLIRLIDGDSIKSSYVTPNLVVRRSCSAPRSSDE